MPEAKNTFIQSKMNKDMDGRILPNGQYRDGENVQISRSEGDDVGALETVLGNIKLTDFGLSGSNLKTIGSYFDDTSNSIFLFITNYTDSSPNQLDNECVAADGVNCYILSYDVQTSTSTILVEGDFLNFSQTHRIIGINLLENLLFWTDNRNQPRKIDINLAVANYYRREDQISVAKYYPYTSPLLMQYVGRPTGGFSADWIGWESTMTDTTSEYLPIHTAAKVKRDEGPSEYILYGRYTNIMPNTDGLIGSPNGCLITGDGVPSGTTVASISVTGDETTITVSPSFVAADNQILYFQFKNPSYLLTWPGDPEYLKDKFVRFSYRFKFDNNEYSLIAPFTQIAFIPQQDGYFIGDKARQNIEIPVSGGTETISANPDMFGQEAETFDSTVVPFMQNKVTNIDVCLIAPSVGNSLSNIDWSQINNVLKVTEVDILLKESSTNNIYVVETLGLDKLKNVDSEYLFYNYQSKKPWRTLPTDQVTRVSDVVPLRALAQEVTGNRVIYGNFVEKNASPERLSYHLSVGQKPFIPTFFDSSTKFEEDQYVRKEYQNHTLKQNRTYQVGVVLSDRYGRKSNVILSELIDVDSSKKNSTIFHNYANSNDLVIYDDQQFVDQGADTWPGDLLSIVWTSIIPVESTQNGYPGVYSVNDGTLQRVLVNQSTSTIFPANDDCVFDVVNVLAGATASIQAFSDANGLINEVKIRSSNNKWKDGMELVSDFFPAGGGGFPCNGWTNQTFRGNAVCPADRPLGWYSYNIVVKQTEQEYYNVYMPNALAGYPCNQNPTGNVSVTFGETPSMVYPIGQQNTTSHLTLFGDNINKIPRDLNEVGPEQNSFRSSERLFHRVESILFSDNDNNIQYSSQPYSPSASGDKVVTISNMSKLDLGNLITNPAYPILPNLIYKANTDPFIARISTEERFGITANSTINACITTESKVDPDLPDDPPLIQVNNTTYASGPTLSISETQPVESLLDIFWETSTSGLIADLNDKIENQDNTAPSGLSPVQISWSEGDPYESSISGQFSAIGSTGLALVGDSEIELVSVIRGDNVSCIDQFNLVQLGFGEVELKIAAASSVNPGFLHWQDQLKNQYNFKFTITQLSTGSTAIQEITGFLSNKPPVERLQTVSGTDINWEDVKEAICAPGALTTKNQRENAQTMSLKAEQGSQKYGLTWENIPGRLVKWRQYVESEEAFPNTPVNFGFISPTDDKYYNAAPFWRNTDHPCCVDTDMDGGDIMISGQYDFGWFGGPSIPGEQFFKDGNNKFRTLWYSPGDNDLNSCTYSQKIYAPDPFLYQVNNEIYPVNGNSDDWNEMGKYFRGATSWGSQPDINWNSSILNETAFKKEVTTNLGEEEWDGTFAARNGEYGSDIIEGWPNINGSPSGIGTSLEMEWSIPRMYQVSMMIPHGSKPNTNANTSFGPPGTGAMLFDIPYVWLMPSRTAAIVGTGTTGSKYFDVQPAGEVIFGLIPESTIDSYDNNERNSILKYLPKGPVYWDSSSNSARDGFQGESQLDPENRIGEFIVGAKSNVYSDPTGNPYPHHYWPDLNALLQDQNSIAVPDYSSFRNGNNAEAPDFMKLQDGANTFYQFNREHSTFISQWQGGLSDTAYQWPWKAKAVKNCGSWRQNSTAINALGHLFYLGGIQGGYGSSNNGQTFFVAPEPIQPGLTSSKAKIHAGPVNGSATSWSGPNKFGQGLPGGRYVVTLRATDVGGDGAFVEWDVPIYLPWWSTRTNSPLRL